MKLFDVHRRSLSLKKFLNELKIEMKKRSLTHFIEEIDRDLKNMETDEFKKICVNLNKIRNAKYAHIGDQNFIDELIPKEFELSLSDIEFLLDKIKEIVCRYGIFFDKNFYNYISSSDSVSDILIALEPICCDLILNSELTEQDK